jgi:hypothetical protein
MFWSITAKLARAGQARQALADSASPMLERISIRLHELSAMPKASQRLLEDSAFDVEGWLAGADPGRPLVRWPGSMAPSFHGHDLDAYLLALPPEQVWAIREGDVPEAVRLTESAARNALLLEEARARGIEASDPQRAALRERWTARVSEWATSLGFRSGLADRAVKERALSAVTDLRQDVLLAREEVRRLSEALRRIYPREALHRSGTSP